MKTTTLTTKKAISIKGVARYLTGGDYEDMLTGYRKGLGMIAAPRGQRLTRAAFENLSSYLGERL